MTVRVSRVTKMSPTNFFKSLLFWVDVTGDSMSPVLLSGRSYLASALRRPKVGRIVVFTHPNSPRQRMVKRIVCEVSGGYIVEGTHPDSIDSDAIGVVPANTIIGTLFRS